MYSDLVCAYRAVLTPDFNCGVRLAVKLVEKKDYLRSALSELRLLRFSYKCL
jgi:hypothetical protein